MHPGHNDPGSNCSEHTCRWPQLGNWSLLWLPEQPRSTSAQHRPSKSLSRSIIQHYVILKGTRLSDVCYNYYCRSRNQDREKTMNACSALYAFKFCPNDYRKQLTFNSILVVAVNSFRSLISVSSV